MVIDYPWPQRHKNSNKNTRDDANTIGMAEAKSDTNVCFFYAKPILQTLAIEKTLGITNSERSTNKPTLSLQKNASFDAHIKHSH